MHQKQDTSINRIRFKSTMQPSQPIQNAPKSLLDHRAFFDIDYIFKQPFIRRKKGQHKSLFKEKPVLSARHHATENLDRKSRISSRHNNYISKPLENSKILQKSDLTFQQKVAPYVIHANTMTSRSRVLRTPQRKSTTDACYPIQGILTTRGLRKQVEVNPPQKRSRNLNRVKHLQSNHIVLNRKRSSQMRWGESDQLLKSWDRSAQKVVQCFKKSGKKVIKMLQPWSPMMFDRQDGLQF